MSATLQPGQPAPDFCLMGDDGKEHDLRSFRGRTVILYFYPRDATPGCTTEARDFRDLHAAILARGAVVIGVSPDSVESHRRFRAREALPFLLLSDPDGRTAAAYGAFGEKVRYGKRTQGILRSTFIIDPEGRIQAIYPRVQVKGHAAAVAAAIGAISA